MDECDKSLDNSSSLSSPSNSKESSVAGTSEEGLQHQDTSKLRKVLHEKLDALKNLSDLVDMDADLLPFPFLSFW